MIPTSSRAGRRASHRGSATTEREIHIEKGTSMQRSASNETFPPKDGVQCKRALLISLAIAGSLSCQGVLGDGGNGTGEGRDGDGDTDSPSDVEKTDPGTRPLRRLTIMEFNNTLRDLLETDVTLPDTFPEDTQARGFNNQGASQTLASVHLEHYDRTIEEAVDDLLQNESPPQWLSCRPGERADCARDVLAQFVPLARRRPAEPGDVDQLVDVYETTLADGNTPEVALSYALQAVLLSPRFLFLLESDPVPDGDTPRPLDDWELASRLSYLLWSSMPDETLFSVAAEERLNTDGELATQVTRMLADEKAEALLDGFVTEWLPLRALETAAPDPEMFPSFDEDLRRSMAEETRLMMSEILFEGRPATELLVSDSTYINDSLADLYRIPSPGTSEMELVSGIEQYGRSGVLTQASFLTALAKTNDTAVIMRGSWVVENLLCLEIPPPPPGIPDFPEPLPDETKRERLARHQVDPSCVSCHSVMDPVGLALETYDPIGEYREVDQNGVPIEVAGDLPDGRAFVNALDLARVIEEDPGFPRCLAEHLMVYALGRQLTRPGQDANAMDHHVLEEVTESFVDSGMQMAELIEQIVLSPSFRNRRGAAE